jgi:putative ABC transport system ATP-binding protein
VNAEAALLELRDVAKTYDGDVPVPAPHPTTVSIHEGDHVAITGPSGSGKSTLLNILGLLDSPTAGLYAVQGNDMAAATERERGARPSGSSSGLSGGEKQRVAIARAVAQAPKVLVCDEPTGNLDSINTRMVADLLAELNSQGLTIIIVTHDEQLAQEAHRRLRVSDGTVTEMP